MCDIFSSENAFGGNKTVFMYGSAAWFQADQRNAGLPYYPTSRTGLSN